MLTFAPKEPQSIYVAEQNGIIYKITGSQISSFLDVSENLPTFNSPYDERGLLGLCFHPDFTTQRGRFFIFYSTKIDKYPQKNEKKAKYYNCLSEFNVVNGHVLYEEEIVLIKIPKNLDYHNGGKIAFGPDGFLYITIGDGGPQGDPEMKAQDLSQIYGKILRIDVRQTGPLSYLIPRDNPFQNKGLLTSSIYAYGFRNPWGLCFWKNHPIVTDAGSDSGIGKERIYIVNKGGNYGWPIIEGSVVRISDNTKHLMNQPIFEYTTGQSGFASIPTMSAIIGGFTYNNDLLFGDISGMIHRYNLQDRRYIEGGQIH